MRHARGEPAHSVFPATIRRGRCKEACLVRGGNVVDTPAGADVGVVQVMCCVGLTGCPR